MAPCFVCTVLAKISVARFVFCPFFLFFCIVGDGREGNWMKRNNLMLRMYSGPFRSVLSVYGCCTRPRTVSVRQLYGYCTVDVRVEGGYCSVGVQAVYYFTPKICQNFSPPDPANSAPSTLRRLCCTSGHCIDINRITD